MATRPIMPPVYFLATLVTMVVVNAFFPVVQIIQSRTRFGAVLLIVFGGWLAAAGSKLFDKHQTTVRPFEESTALVKDGPYQYSRNPMYLGMVVLLVGVATILGTLTPFLIIPLFVWVITARFIVHEEEALERRFGQEYHNYRATVRRWL